MLRLVPPMRSNLFSHHRSRRFYSEKSSSQRPAVSKLAAHAATASVFLAAGIWWATARKRPLRPQNPSTDELVGTSDCSPTAITTVLSRNAHSRAVLNVLGINKYDTAQLASNTPCEDRLIHGQFISPWRHSERLIAWGVFDGHAGWQTADLLTKQLLPLVQTHLGQVIPSRSDGVPPDQSVQQAIMEAFVDLDDSIIATASATAESDMSLPEKMQKLVPAFAGSCALLSVYDPNTTKLHVACTGDSRAVLGQKQPNGKWTATPLSIDQNTKNKDEVARLNAEHPDEEDIVKDGRLFGLVVSRAFGDGRWKWPVDLQQSFVRRFYGYPVLPDIASPPYLTAEPVVTSTTIDRKTPSFLIMASDGLWDLVSDEEAVGLVDAWLSARQSHAPQVEPSEVEYGQFDFSHFWKGVNWKFEEDRMIVQDENVAVHLIRNSLGGTHHEMIAGRLTLGTPFARRLRDDITVQVIFFNVPDV